MSRHSPSSDYRIPPMGRDVGVAMPQPNEGLGRALRDAFEPMPDRTGDEFARLLDRLV